jgi:hypothetical protein
MTNPATAMVTLSDLLVRFQSEEGYCTALSHDGVRSSEQVDQHCRAGSNALKITAPRRAPNQPGTVFSETVSFIEGVDWKDENNELDC